MKKKEVIEVMELLDDKDIIAKIKKIIHDMKNSTNTDKNECKEKYLETKKKYDDIVSNMEILENSKAQLQKEYDELLKELKTTKRFVKQIEDENNLLKEENLSINTDLCKEKEISKNLKSKIDRYHNNFQESIQLFHKFSTIPDDIRESLSNTISNESIILFIISCSQYRNLESLWDYTKSMYINNEETETLKILKDIFYYFFGRYNSLYEEIAYEFDDTEEGDYFDDDKNIKGYNSASSGKITKVLLKGYKSVNTGNYIRKSVVQV